MIPTVLAQVTVVADELDPDGQLIDSVRQRIGPALARAFDDLVFDSTACAVCKTPVGGIHVGDDDHPTWRTVVLVSHVSHGRSWALCEECGESLDPPA